MSSGSFGRSRFWSLCLVTTFLTAVFPAVTFAQDSQKWADRRKWATPGLILDTGARHATCDMLTFTPDGSELLASGDDKVVRIWGVDRQRFIDHHSKSLRWPIFRESRGGIYALALSPDPEASQVVICGEGLITGYLAVLDRKTGDVRYAMTKPESQEVIWSVAWSPDGKYVVYGCERGSVFRWDVKRSKTSELFTGSGGRESNRVRLVAFVDDTHFISVAQDGYVREWDVTNPEAEAREWKTFRLRQLYRVTLSEDGRWLAACGEGTGAGALDPRQVEVIDWKKLRAGGSGVRSMITFPEQRGSNRYPQALAFDSSGKRLAIGVRVVPLPRNNDEFARITGGEVRVFSVPDGTEVTTAAMNLGYRAERVAFRPGYRNQLATAGGNNHEVRLWDLTRPDKPLDTIRGPGSCLWGVGMSGTRYLAWQEHRSSYPTPTTWGAGPWRILDMQTRSILDKEPEGFAPAKPLASYGGWEVEPTANGAVWSIVCPDGMKVPLTGELYILRRNQLPRCYTFLAPTKTNPDVRLAVGHAFGLTLYELAKPHSVRLVRVMIGHESEVMAVAPAANGQLLLSASRDETLAGWSLEKWPSQRELGASFRDIDGKILVRDVDPGSPAWEAGLTPDDEITVVISANRSGVGGVVFNPNGRDLAKDKMVLRGRYESLDNAGILEKLKNVEGNREIIFYWKHEGKLYIEKTTVKQRPLWRFFPVAKEFGRDWVMWRWRDYYYDTSSVKADQFVGWQVNAGTTVAKTLTEKPRFYPLEYFGRSDDIRGPKGEARGFHRPDKVWRLGGPGISEARRSVIFPDIEPPDVKVEVVQNPGLNTDLKLAITIKPRGTDEKQKLARVTLWLDDYRYNKPPKIVKGVVDDKNVVINRGDLRNGRNEITVQCFNEEGGRGQATVSVDYNDPTKTKRNLYALCVGINDYSGVKGFADVDPEERDLRCPAADAEGIATILKDQQNSRLYKKSVVELVPQRQATAKEIKKRLLALGKNVDRNDWLVLFLSGHGSAKTAPGMSYVPGSFFYLCKDTDIKQPSTYLSSKDLYEILATIKCRKWIILDTCRSGGVGVSSDPLRDLTREGMPFLIFSSCERDESALELKKGPMKHGFFTQSFINAIDAAAQPAGKPWMTPVTADEAAGRDPQDTPPYCWRSTRP